ncbi:hypothetical protein BDZ97DRAFT_1367269 [Flammula alnicola]|nr:hypothetical protein BDZ97DRAFT_1367269 [Flammula alnicola]
MVIIDPSEEPNSPDERSPLKTGQLNPTTQAAAGAPPPPYDAAASREPHQYQSVTVVQHSYVPEPVAHPRTEGPLKRFIRAFAVALIVLFLWGMFLDSLDMLTGNKGGKRRGGRTYEERITLEWLIHDWSRVTYPISSGTPASYRDNVDT